MAMMGKSLLALLTLMVGPNHVSAELVKVVVLARHGNRAPNPQVLWVCPNAMQFVSEWQEPVEAKQRASLSRVGMAENDEAGKFLRQRYRQGTNISEDFPETHKILPDGPFYDDGSTFFFSERMNRNIVSTLALTRGMFPDGTGQDGFAHGSPNLVPILTSQPFRDQMMNLPRDGPCKAAYNHDRESWTRVNQDRIIEENHDLLVNFSNACGFDFINNHIRDKSLAWTLKAASDAFHFAEGEGIDTSSVVSREVLDPIIALAGDISNAQRFGQRHQWIYWVGTFLDQALFANILEPEGRPRKEKLEAVGHYLNPKNPWQDAPLDWFNRNKFLLFLNHRELIVSIAHILGLTEMLTSPPPAGSMVLFELHLEDGEYFVRILTWAPSAPSFAQKNEYLRERKYMTTLYRTGTVTAQNPTVCARQDGMCTIQELQLAYLTITDEVGTWEQVCGLVDEDAEPMLLADQSMKSTRCTRSKLDDMYISNAEIESDDGDDEDGWRTNFEKMVFGHPACDESSQETLVVVPTVAAGGWTDMEVALTAALMASLSLTAYLVLERRRYAGANSEYEGLAGF